ncbi:MAG: bifunctional 2-polyprenyl-6-hydroxyphenol methylase/3-demethylubiquinol 3-O-methyltransferase UbiG [Pseudomonadota bacterium]
MSETADLREIAKFDAIAAGWWDPDGDFRPLHDLNPIRLGFIERHAELDGLRVLDVGCGAGLLSEAMAAAGADVTGIDLSNEALAAGRRHMAESALTVDYRHESIEAHIETGARDYDMVTCLEMLEHVPDPAGVIRGCATVLRPGGRLFLSTLNRNLFSFALGIVGAEYVLGLLPRGTHEYRRFIRPSELARSARRVGLDLLEQKGIVYNPAIRKAALRDDVTVNYLVCFEKPDSHEAR